MKTSFTMTWHNLHLSAIEGVPSAVGFLYSDLLSSS